MKAKTRTLCFCAITAAAYSVMTMVFAPISYGLVQCRVSEALCILPFYFPQTAWGLFAGCIIANLMTGNVVDVLFGSLATLLSCICIAKIGKAGKNLKMSVLACTMPVLFNAVIVGAVITSAYSGLKITEHLGTFALYAFQVAIGEALVMFLIGLPLMRLLPRNKYAGELYNKLREDKK